MTEAESVELPPPPEPIRPDGVPDDYWDEVVTDHQVVPPSMWRTEDGTIYSRRTPSWLTSEAPGLLVDSAMILKPGDEHYDWFAEQVEPFYDYYREGDEDTETEPEPEFSWYDPEEPE